MGGRSIYTVMRQEAKIRNASCDISNLSLEIKKESVEVFWLSPHGSDNTSPACWFPATAHIHLWIPLGLIAGLDAPGLPCGSSPVALAVLQPGGPQPHPSAVGASEQPASEVVPHPVWSGVLWGPGCCGPRG